MAIACRGFGFRRISILAGAFLAMICLVGGLSVRLYAQNLPIPNANIAEQQDYAFADGLFRDGLFQIASEQLDKFVKKYP